MRQLLVLGFLLMMLSGFQKAWPAKLTAKVEKTVELTFETTSYELKGIEISDDAENQTSAELKNSLFEVNSEEKLLGYLYVNQAPSMKNVFDYAVIFDPAYKIINAKVLIYRETHGKQIGAKRWLSQFFGMDLSDRPKLGEDVDGITGATISVKGMTTAVNHLLESIDKLHQEGNI
ncbi:FMN-binding protein [Portibacter lacus]|uniref:FMN-binding domain-containing protein n=1 Tax=Portibacter lacus TaxID=1099794 RepID=A0AA37SNB5_9BACT|nr:FMN-binding protein [Portibacter lacus]GLR16937.1 hypothetical protein GCM10007940_15520 [Portibacter lacus]